MLVKLESFEQHRRHRLGKKTERKRIEKKKIQNECKKEDGNCTLVHTPALPSFPSARYLVFVATFAFSSIFSRFRDLPHPCVSFSFLRSFFSSYFPPASPLFLSPGNRKFIPTSLARRWDRERARSALSLYILPAPSVLFFPPGAPLRFSREQKSRSKIDRQTPSADMEVVYVSILPPFSSFSLPIPLLRFSHLRIPYTGLCVCSKYRKCARKEPEYCARARTHSSQYKVNTFLGAEFHYFLARFVARFTPAPLHRAPSFHS